MIGRGDKVERRLRSDGPEAREEFVDALARRVVGRRQRVTSRLAFVAAAVTLLLGTVASIGGAAYAQSSASDQYDQPQPSGEGGALPASEQQPPEQAIAAAPTGGTLPFTGVSLAVTGVVGLGLAGAGVALRRIERRRTGSDA